MECNSNHLGNHLDFLMKRIINIYTGTAIKNSHTRDQENGGNYKIGRGRQGNKHLTCAVNVVCKVRTQLTLYARNRGARDRNRCPEYAERSRCSGLPEKGKISEERRTKRQRIPKWICKASVRGCCGKQVKKVMEWKVVVISLKSAEKKRVQNLFI